jgi:hypothetical protein
MVSHQQRLLLPRLQCKGDKRMNDFPKELDEPEEEEV